MSEPKNVAFIGPEVSTAGKTLVHHLKTGHHVVQQGSIHPEVEENIKIGAVSVKAFIAPANEGSRRLFQETIIEDLSACHGVVYLLGPESAISYKAELGALLSRVSPIPVLVLVIVDEEAPVVEELSKELGLQDYPNGRIKLSVSTLPLAAESEGFEWLSLLLSES